MIGCMMFCRAGVTVRGGTHFIEKNIAETSKIYFTFRRNNRPYEDLSHGWGHNSQWRTDFRRDYVTDSEFYYNVDNNVELVFPDQRIELLTNRCLIRSINPTCDPDEYSYPYKYTYKEGHGKLQFNI